jgi:hypothetical protein
MDVLTFIARILEIVAWPAVAITVFFFLRNPIRKAVAAWETIRLKYKEMEGEFTRRIENLKQEADEASLPSSHYVETTTTTTPPPSPPEPALEKWVFRVSGGRAGLCRIKLDFRRHGSDVQRVGQEEHQPLLAIPDKPRFSRGICSRGT